VDPSAAPPATLLPVAIPPVFPSSTSATASPAPGPRVLLEGCSPRLWRSTGDFGGLSRTVVRSIGSAPPAFASLPLFLLTSPKMSELGGMPSTPFFRSPGSDSLVRSRGGRRRIEGALRTRLHTLSRASHEGAPAHHHYSQVRAALPNLCLTVRQTCKCASILVSSDIGPVTPKRVDQLRAKNPAPLSEPGPILSDQCSIPISSFTARSLRRTFVNMPKGRRPLAQVGLPSSFCPFLTTLFDSPASL
jgi:hypothetical protein